MSIMNFGEGFPYANFHDLNMDWIIKIAKDFLDQYTHIQEVIANGEESLENLTTSGLAQLQDKADALEALLQAWYNEHSEDIANELAQALADLNDWYTEHSGDIADQLADALEDLNAWYTLHENYLDQTLTDNISAFNTAAESKAVETIASIPDDYTSLSEEVADLTSAVFLEKDCIAESQTNNALYDISTHEVITVSGYKTQLYKIDPFAKRYYITGSLTAGSEGFAIVSFLDSSMDYISSLYASPIDETLTKQIIDIPSGASYFYLCTISAYGSVDALYDNVSYIRSASLDTKEISYKTLTPGKLYNITTGELVSVGSTYKLTQYDIDDNVEYLLITADLTAGSAGYAVISFFDENDNYLGSEYKSPTSYALTDELINLLDGTAYIYVNTYDMIPTVKAVYSIAKEAYEIASESAGVLFETETIDDAVTYNGSMYYIVDTPRLVSGLGGSFFCKKIVLETGNEYLLTSSMEAGSPGFPLAAYTNENDEYIGYEYNNEANVPISVTDAVLNPPEGAKYLYANSRTSFAVIKRRYSRIDELEKEISDEKEEYEINVTPIHGQSLSLAIVRSAPAIHTDNISGGLMMSNGVYQVGDTLANMTGIAMLSMGHDSYYHELYPDADTYESSAWGTAEIIKKLCEYDKALLPQKNQFYSACGQDGGSISTQFDTELTVMQDIFTAVKNLIPYKKVGAPVVYWIQGEADNNAGTTIETYKNALIAGIKSISTMAKGTFGQKNGTKCISYQTAFTNNNDRSHYTASIAQMELCRDSNDFAPSCPAYILIKSPNDDKLHLSNWGEYLLGQYQGIQFYSWIVNGKKNVGVMPLKNGLSYSSNKITIQFAVEVPPLRFVTDWVSSRTHYGFEVISNGVDILQSVEIVGIDKVVLTCSQNVAVGDAVYYAMQAVAYGNHLEGSGGNLCDSQGDTITATIDQTEVALNNYCYAFTFTIE